MLSKIAGNTLLLRPLGLRKLLLTSSLKSTTSAEVVNYTEEKERLMLKLKEDLPKPYDGPERDLVNFPRRKRLDDPGKVRFGILPDEWFTFFHKKTGITGPYVFGTGLLTFLFSKELYVIDEELSTGVAQILLIYIFVKKFGPKCKEWLFKLKAEKEKEFEDVKKESIQDLEDLVKHEKELQWQCGTYEILSAAKRENVQMQLETEYRHRLMNVYEQVKKRLDFHLDMDNTRRKLEQRHMVEWIVASVLKSITPQQEKDALQKCLADLKVLSARG